MLRYIIVAILLILVLAFVYFAFFHKPKSREQQRDDHVAASTGGFDEHARAALATTDVPEPTPRDHFVRARIFAYNVPQHRQRALRPAVAQEFTMAVPGVQTIDLHHIEDWLEMTLLGEALGDGDFQFLMPLEQAINNWRPEVVERTITERAVEAAAEPTRELAVAKMLEEQFPNEPQTVHDNTANKDLNETLAKYRHDMPIDVGGADNAATEIRTWLHRNPGAVSEDAARRALQTLDVLAKNEYVSTYGVREQELLNIMWARCSHPNNNEQNAREAVVLALADSIEGGQPVCTGGRAARLINSLARVDYSGDTGALTFSAYKNQIFRETQNIIEAELDRRAADTASELDREFAIKYRAGDALDTPELAEAERQFKDEATAKITENINKYSNLRDTDKTTLTTECLAALTF